MEHAPKLNIVHTRTLLTALARSKSIYFLGIFSGFLQKGTFQARLMIMEKSKNNEGVTETTYRPICLINSIVEPYKNLINQKFNKAIKPSNCLSKIQYGYRKGTVAAIKNLVGLAKYANSKIYKIFCGFFKVGFCCKNTLLFR